ncbi:hypothetical protein D3C74_334720 [compost metagenome]
MAGISLSMVRGETLQTTRHGRGSGPAYLSWHGVDDEHGEISHDGSGGHRRGSPRGSCGAPGEDHPGRAEGARRPRARRPRLRQPPQGRGRCRCHRRGQAVEPQQGEPGGHRGPGLARLGVREGRRGRHLGADRAAPLQRQPRGPRRGPCQGGHPRPAQGLRRDPVPGLGGSGPRRGPRPADRRGPRADGADVARRAGPLARHDGSRRGAHARRGHARDRRGCPGDRGQRARPQDARGRPDHVRTTGPGHPGRAGPDRRVGCPRTARRDGLRTVGGARRPRR